MDEASSVATKSPVLQERVADMARKGETAEVVHQQRRQQCSSCSHNGSSNRSNGNDTGNTGSTKSLAEHAVKYVFENGRRYCNDIYSMPNDEVEQTRQSILHQLYLTALDGQLTLIPLPDSPSRILDLGSGPADWAIAIGEEYPDTEVIATDISLFDPQSVSIAPPNVYFQIDDAEGKWTFHEPFDFIHVRGLSRAISNWPRLYQQAFDHLKPGGAIQVVDGDLSTESLPPNSYFNIFVSAVRSAADVAGYMPEYGHLRPSALIAAGFGDIQTYHIEVPIGTWPTDPKMRTMGKMGLIVVLEGLEAISMRLLTKYMGWKAEDVIDLCEKVKMEVVSYEGAMGSAKIVVARKPLAVN
ncbi:hypothetical protein D8B26_006514 [Coccidioides posadasii str. Silveira]|uniref:Uncharacterized protein n=1 Tax=Coccidioides posadasii (strain RMSCC 757 / Silveira) TaxID=443226 RepID=E9CTH3_COCPS|nr:conserved hypothetical protein [Coccidioides posadasii str. Silveira]QVM11871.1 hypothetical protein D8B26_006514 [Coccidioides posadasii str. Silveira]